MKSLSRVARVAILAVALATALPATPAQAGARGCSYWKASNYPSGYYCVEISGNGTYVDWVGGGFKAAGNVCNWNITAEFFDSNGNWYQTRNGAKHYECVKSREDVIPIRAYVRRGFMCSTLKSNGARITSVCHNIY